MRPPAYVRPHFAEWLLLVVLAWHLSVWVVAPALAYEMLPLDTLELLGWGQEWQLGYYKHPPLGAWLGEATLELAGGWLPSLYLLAQLVLVVTLVYVWKTARLWLDRDRAAIAALLLQGSYFHTVLVPNFNMNTLQLPLWAGFCYHLLRALRGAPRHWLAVGAFAALALLAKYSGLLLLATGVALVLVLPEGRASLRTRWPWLGAALALLLLAPHLVWLAEHWRLPLAYLASFDAPGDATWHAQLLEPLRFAAGALLSLLLALVLLVPLLGRSHRPGAPSGGHPRATRSDRTERRDRWIVAALALGPLLLTMVYGMSTGSRLKSTWAFPFFSLAGLALLMSCPTRTDRTALRRFAGLLAVVGLLVAGGHFAYKLRSERPKTAFDGPALAAAVVDAWQSQVDAPLRIVIANHVLSAIVSGYAPTRPSMLVNADPRLSPWVDADRLERHGAIAVCAGGTPCFAALRPSHAPQGEIEVDGRAFQYWILRPQR